MPVVLRPFDAATDYPALAALQNTIRSEPTSAERIAYADARQPDAELRRRTVAVDASEAVVGVSTLERYAWMHPGEVRINIIVLPAMRRQGIGAVLYDDANRVAVSHGARSYVASLQNSDREAIRFAETRHFRVDRHEFESTLDLAAFDASRFAGVIESVSDAGIRFTTMEAEGDSEANRRRLHTLHRDAALDNPGSTGSFPPYADYARFIYDADWYQPALVLLAVDGDQYAGLSMLHLFAATRCMYTEFTGVDRAYRGRHLALALKLHGVQAALMHGATYMRTDNDAQNAPILAVNRKLGYRPAPGFYQMRADVVEPETEGDTSRPG